MCQAFWEGGKTIFALQHKFPSLPETDFRPKRFDPQTLRRCDKTGWRDLTCNIGPSSWILLCAVWTRVIWSHIWLYGQWWNTYCPSKEGCFTDSTFMSQQHVFFSKWGCSVYRCSSWQPTFNVIKHFWFFLLWSALKLIWIISKHGFSVHTQP